jgi:hypothetical protein
MFRRMVDPVGTVFFRLTVIRSIGWVGRHFRVVARCECDTEKEFSLDLIQSGATKSCGCLRRDRAHKLNETHRQAGTGRTPLYRAWEAMRDRVRRKEPYVSRGIKVCPEWEASFEAFRDYVAASLGPRPRGHTVDRIENSKNYEPGNIRWASAKQQQRNTSRNTIITVDGVSRCIAEWAEASGISSAVICARRKHGWSDALAVTAPLQQGRRS